MSARGDSLRHLLLAVQFFTRIPMNAALARWVGFSPAMLRASAAHLTAVGWLVGMLGAMVLGGALSLWPPAVAAVLCTVSTVLVTGAFHEDGLADLADGLGGTQDRARALEIMRDSRIGAFGAIALVLALGLKLALLAALAGQGAASACTAVVAAHVLSRLAPLGLMRWLPHAGGEASKSKLVADSLGDAALGVALAWALPAAALLMGVFGIATGATALAGAALASVAMARWLRHRLGGYTGDGLGATQQVAELAVYLALAARW